MSGTRLDSAKAALLPSILVLVCAALWPALAGPFLFDDFHNLGRLAQLQGVLDWTHIRDYLASFPGSIGRPLSALSFLLNDYAWPSDPRPFKYTNLLIHLFNGVLVFGLARALARLRPRLAGIAEWIALACALIWLIHPIQISASMLTVQRMTLLSASFGLAGLWAYVALARRARTWRGAAAAVLALGTGTVLAFLCKENGALIPPLAWVINATLLRDSLARAIPSVRRVLALGVIVPTFAVALAFALQLYSGASFARRDFTLVQRLLTEGRVLSDYLIHIGLPRLSGAGIYFDDYLVSRSLFEPPSTIAALIAVGALLGAAFALRRRSPVIAFGLLWFFCGHALESTALPLELYFEHRNYLPLFGLAFALVAMVAQSTGTLRRPLVAGLSLWALLLVLISHSQAKVWGNERALATFWAAEHPRSERAALHRAEFLARQGEVLAARQFLVEASGLQPHSTAVPLQVMLIDCQMRREIGAGELQEYRARLATGGFSNATLPALRDVRELIRRGFCPGMGMADWLALAEAALENPSFVPSDAQAFLRVERGYAFVDLRDLPKATHEFEMAYAAERSPGLALNIAFVMISAGDRQAASEWARRASATRERGLMGMLSQDQARARAFHEAIQKELADRPDGT